MSMMSSSRLGIKSKDLATDGGSAFYIRLGSVPRVEKRIYSVFAIEIESRAHQISGDSLEEKQQVTLRSLPVFFCRSICNISGLQSTRSLRYILIREFPRARADGEQDGLDRFQHVLGAVDEFQACVVSIVAFGIDPNN